MNFRKSVPIFHCIIPHSLPLFATNPCAFELNFCLYVGSPFFSIQLSVFSTAGKSVNFHVDLCAQCPELHRFKFNTATDTHRMEIFHSPFYIMNGVPEAQSENIKFSDALQGDSFQIKLSVNLNGEKWNS